MIDLMDNLELLSAVADIVLVSALVGVTWWYARSAKRQAKTMNDQAVIMRENIEIMRKEGEKSKIIESCHILYPCYIQLNSDIGYLKNKKYGWDGRSWNIKKLWSSSFDSLRYIHFKEKFSGITKKIEIHDKKVDKIKEKLKRLDKMIFTSDFEEECKKFIDKFNEKHEKEIKDRKVRSPSYKAIPSLVEHIIDNEDKVEKLRSYSDFWDEYRLELLKVRDEKSIKREIEALYIYSDELKEISFELKNDIERRLLNYKKKYNLTDNEIMPRKTAPETS